MQLTFPQKPIAHSILWGTNKPSLLCSIVLIVLGSLLIGLSSKVAIPLKPVPITLQSLAVLLVAMTYGFRLGVAAVSVYLVAGLLGLPAFATGNLSMTWGYLFGFLIAAAPAQWHIPSVSRTLRPQWLVVTISLGSLCAVG
jgi:biotin transport system substrate-specific component